MPYLSWTATKKPYACICNQCIRLHSSRNTEPKARYYISTGIYRCSTLDFARIPIRQESARINASYYVFTSRPQSLTGASVRSAIAKLINISENVLINTKKFLCRSSDINAEIISSIRCAPMVRHRNSLFRYGIVAPIINYYREYNIKHKQNTAKSINKMPQKNENTLW